jgi:hypothetical protein
MFLSRVSYEMKYDNCVIFMNFLIEVQIVDGPIVVGWQKNTDNTKKLVLWNPLSTQTIYSLLVDKEIVHIYESKAHIGNGDILLSTALQTIAIDKMQTRCLEIRIDVETRKMNINIDMASEYLNLYGNELSSIYKTQNHLLLGTTKGQVVILYMMQVKRIFQFSCAVRQLLM